MSFFWLIFSTNYFILKSVGWKHFSYIISWLKCSFLIFTKKLEWKHFCRKIVWCLKCLLFFRAQLIVCCERFLSDFLLTVSMPMSNSLGMRHVDGQLWLKLIPLLCKQPHIQSTRQTDCTPRTASKWRGTAGASLCLSFLSSFTPNRNLISVDNNTGIYTPTPTLNLHPLNKEVTWWPDEIEMTLNY